MKKPAESGAINIAAVQSRMLTIRNQQVLLDRDVAALYGVQTKEINQAIRNNPGKFPEGFVFQLNEDEFENWKSKILTSNLSAREIAVIKMGIRRAPYALTERGLYMLATILKGEVATRATLGHREHLRPGAFDGSRHGGDPNGGGGVAGTGESAHAGRPQACWTHRRQSLHGIAEDHDRAESRAAQDHTRSHEGKGVSYDMVWRRG